MKDLVQKQRQFYNSGRTKNNSFRKNQLRKLKKVLSENEDFLYEAIYKDFKKSEFETYGTELGLLYHDIDEAISKIDSWTRRSSVSTNTLNMPASSYILHEPLGVSLVIGAWNYPYQLSLAPVIPAIAAGNTVILKPSELPENTSHALYTIISENFDEEFFAVVEGGVPETTELLEQKFDKIFFTGSPRVGKIIYKAAAENLTPVTLELGGKSPCFVCEDCNMNVAVKRIVWGKFINAGQTCIAPDYLVVHESIKDEFIQKMKVRIEEMNYSFENGNYVQIINEDNFDRLTDLIDPHKVVYGGKSQREDRYIQPTIMDNVNYDDKIMSEEIFGPVLPVISYRDLDCAIDKVKMLDRPLSCYTFTSSKRKKRTVNERVQFGGGAVNDTLMHISNPSLPFGGVGNSGIGNYHGKAGFEAFSHPKSILDKSTLVDPSIKYPPYKKWKLKILKWFIG